MAQKRELIPLANYASRGKLNLCEPLAFAGADKPRGNSSTRPATPRQFIRRCITAAFSRLNNNEGLMFHNKSNFAAALSGQFLTSANWRKGQAKRFKDSRNDQAAQRLLELESQILITDAVWQALAPLVSNPACLGVISQTNRDVGFRTKPSGFSAWLENLHANLTHH